MGWIRKLPATKHECWLPATNGLFGRDKVGVGSVYQCDDCRKYWKFTNQVNGQWEEITQSEALPKAPRVPGGMPQPPKTVFVK